MDIQAEKRHLIEELAKTQDVRIIEQIKNLFLKKTDSLAGYDINGKAITRQQLIERIEEADERVNGGEYITQQDLEEDYNLNTK